MQNQESSSSTITMKCVIVAPIWLQNVLSVWLQVVGKMELVICATTCSSLDFNLVPDLVIFSAADESAYAEVQKIKQMWPTARLLVLVDETLQESLIEEAGADVVLLLGVSSPRLLSTINDLLHAGLLQGDNDDQGGGSVRHSPTAHQAPSP